jgi:carbon-monoxide dehydrogenase catalytic subunit
MLIRAEELQCPTAWDRSDALQPQCGFGTLGLCCNNCFMGPCRILPFSNEENTGICGADAGLIVARNLARAAAAGAAAHSDHGREAVATLHAFGERGHASGYLVSNPGKLRRLAAEWGVAEKGRSDQEVALDVARKASEQFGSPGTPPAPSLRAPKGQKERWEKQNLTTRGIDREIVELLHRTAHGVESDPVAMMRAAMRTALSDGWGGSMIATDVSDILFGAPEAIRSRANLGVIEKDKVNILVHGHEPILSEMVARVSREKESIELAKQAGAKGIVVAGICCTANEILMRQGMPIAGNYLHQELALLTGAVDVMTVDVQCILPSLSGIAACQHTKVVTTSPKAHIPGAHRVEFDHTRPRETAREIIRVAVETFKKRDPSKVRIPDKSMQLVAGFTNENLPYYMGGRLRSGWRPFNDAVAAGRIRGVAGVVGCNTTRVVQDANHLALVRHLIAKDVLVVQTGCSAIASAKEGLMRPEAALEHCCPGLREVCETVGIPPVLHMGSCVDNSRILTACISMVDEGGIGEDISELPVAAAAPEAMSEKAVTIGLYAVASGIFTAFMPAPRVNGSEKVLKYLQEDVEKETGGKFVFSDKVEDAAAAIVAHLDEKRRKLKLPPARQDEETVGAGVVTDRESKSYAPPTGVKALGCGKQQAKSQSRQPEA